MYWYARILADCVRTTFLNNRHVIPYVTRCQEIAFVNYFERFEYNINTWMLIRTQLVLIKHS